jgi:hypothetical protein
MYFLLILFFTSLLGIIIMVGRKLVLIKNGQAFSIEEKFFKTQYLEECKDLTIKNIKKCSYKGLVATIRCYIRSSNFLKNKYEVVKIKIKNMRGKKLNDNEKKEVNKFLKMISEYKHKIREIKHKIREEENNL